MTLVVESGERAHVGQAGSGFEVMGQEDAPGARAPAGEHSEVLCARGSRRR